MTVKIVLLEQEKAQYAYDHAEEDMNLRYGVDYIMAKPVGRPKIEITFIDSSDEIVTEFKLRYG